MTFRVDRGKSCSKEVCRQITNPSSWGGPNSGLLRLRLAKALSPAPKLWMERHLLPGTWLHEMRSAAEKKEEEEKAGFFGQHGQLVHTHSLAYIVNFSDGRTACMEALPCVQGEPAVSCWLAVPRVAARQSL